MNCRKRKWLLRGEVSLEVDEKLAEYPTLIKSLLFNRGIKSAEEAEIFLNPDYKRDLHDPMLMKDMDKAVERILAAIAANEKVAIFADYDADGICGAAVLHSFFEAVGFDNFLVHIPDRQLERYGLSNKALDKFSRDGVALVITVDCGISDAEQIDYANQLGLQVIVTDHHLSQGALPSAHAVIDNKRPDDIYPFKRLCGAAVVWKLAQALLRRGPFNVPKDWEKWLLDLVAIATVSDMVGLVGENRVLTHYGLKVLAKTRRLGLRALLDSQRLDPRFLTEDDISFFIGPRVNIASRFGRGCDAFELLTTKDPATAEALVGDLEGKNKNRRKTVDVILKEVAAGLDEIILPSMIVRGNPDWHLGVLGLTATRLMEQYRRPVCLWTRNCDGELKASVRSDGTVDVVALFEAMGGRQFFTNFGGHSFSGGFSACAEAESSLEEKMVNCYDKLKCGKGEHDIVLIDSQMAFDAVNNETWRQLAKLAPFGMLNSKPLFLFKDLEIVGVREFGNAGIHLELKFEKIDGQIVPAIGFFMEACHWADVNLNIGHRIDLVASIERSVWRGRPELRLKIVDLRQAE